MNTFPSRRHRSGYPQTHSALPRRARHGILVQARFWTVMVAVFALAGCSLYYDFFYPWEKDPLKWTDPDQFDATRVVRIEQGWSPEIMRKFWNKNQGSRFLPYEMYMALEQKDSTKPFRDPANIAKYRYISQLPDPKRNPDGLAIGFALDKGANRNYIGLTCAACHTTAITYEGTAILIEGAPTMADFQSFFQDLSAALNDTLPDGDKKDRFLAKVADLTKVELTKEKKEELEKQLINWAKKRRVHEKMNHTTNRYGFARLDAVGQILNQAVAVNLKPKSGGDYGMPENEASPNAPVSYPFLWGTAQSNVVEWNGIAHNDKVAGALGRNVGEVIGVFGQIEVKRSSTYKSSVRIVNLAILENWIEDLRPPKWPEPILGKINPEMRDAGKALFKQNCSSCHQMGVKPADKYCAILTPLKDIGTDPMMAENSIKPAKTGFLEGRPESVLFGDELPAVAPKLVITTNEVTGVLLYDLGKTLTALAVEGVNLKSVADVQGTLESKASKSQWSKCKGKDNPLAYKARPLNGIWATAPYLHNGSVPTLWDLLVDEKDRPETFKLGGREFDPKQVGFVNYEGDDAFLFDTSRPGNSNEGHNYPDKTKLSPDERWQLVEYLKSI